MVEGRALGVDVGALRIGTNQAEEVARFKFMGIVDEDGEVADAEVTGTSCEDIAHRECAERGIAARAATANRQTLAINKSALYQVFCSISTVINVDHAP